MYLLDVALHNLSYLAKKRMLLIQERVRFFVGGIIVTALQLAHNFTETVQLLAYDFNEIVF